MVAQKTIILIGASSGVGKSLYKKLNINNDIYTLSRSKRIESENQSSHYQCDISDYQVLFHSLCAIKKKRKTIDFLINCAGIGFYSPLDGDYSKYWKKIIDVNLLGLINLISCMKQLDIPKKQFFQIGSLAAHRPSKTIGNLVYSSTKTAALPLLSEFRKELRSQGKKTKITLITPGFIEGTNFERNYFAASPEQNEPLYSKFKGLEPKSIVNIILFAMSLPENDELNEIIIRPTNQID